MYPWYPISMVTMVTMTRQPITIVLIMMVTMVTMVTPAPHPGRKDSAAGSPHVTVKGGDPPLGKVTGHHPFHLTNHDNQGLTKSYNRSHRVSQGLVRSHRVSQDLARSRTVSCKVVSRFSNYTENSLPVGDNSRTLWLDKRSENRLLD